MKRYLGILAMEKAEVTIFLSMVLELELNFIKREEIIKFGVNLFKWILSSKSGNPTKYKKEVKRS